MMHTVIERVLRYDPAQCAAWKRGDKSVIPSFVRVTADVRNQPQYHFSEMFALRWYHETEGWRGFLGYALGTQYPRSRRRLEGRAKVEGIISDKCLRSSHH